MVEGMRMSRCVVVAVDGSCKKKRLCFTAYSTAQAGRHWIALSVLDRCFFCYISRHLTKAPFCEAITLGPEKCAPLLDGY